MQVMKNFPALLFTMLLSMSCAQPKALSGKYEPENDVSESLGIAGLEFFEDSRVTFHFVNEGEVTAYYEVLEGIDGQKLIFYQDEALSEIETILSIENRSNSFIIYDELHVDENYDQIFQKVDEFSFQGVADSSRSNDSFIQAIQSEGKTYTGSAIRAQQAYYVEYGRFSNSFLDLGLEDNIDSDYYRYSIILLDDSVWGAMVLAEARSPEFNSFLGIVVVNDAALPAIICETETPSTAVPRSLDIRGNLTCPSGFSEL